MKGLADSPDDAAAWAGRKPDGKALRMAALQRALSHADADALTATLLQRSKQMQRGPLHKVGLRLLQTLPAYAGVSLAHSTAWSSGAHGSRVLHGARLRLGEDLFAGQDGDDANVCGRSMAAGGTHSLFCGALWHTVVARQNGLTEAWLRIAARKGDSQLPASRV